MGNVTENPVLATGTAELADSPIRSLNSLDLNTAQDRIRSFRDQILHLKDWPGTVSKTKACVIKFTELAGILGINHEAMPDLGIRCYMGLRYDEAVKHDVISLIMVAVRYEASTDSYLDVWKDSNGNPLIFDYTTPCPDTCDTTSPLFNLDLSE